MQKNKSTAVTGINPYTLKILLLLLILIIYGRTTGYEFTLDDDLFIVNNPTVQKGIAGIGEAFSKGTLEHFKGSNFQIYRPATISLMCLEQQMFGSEPAGYHFMNILLYACIGWVLIRLISGLLPNLHPYYQALILLLFITHPIHTEVVASVKSQDELLGSLLCLLSLHFMVNSYATPAKSRFSMTISVFIFFMALFAKESAFAFLAIFPITLFLLKNEKIKNTTLKTLPYLAVGLLFLFLRQLAIRESNIAYETSKLENILYAASNLSQQIGTKLEISFYFLKMMLAPYPMSWDYSFNQIPIMDWNETLPLLSLAAYAVIFSLGFYFMFKKPEISFGLAFFITLIAPTANIFFLNGTSFGDRFLFLPSLGFIIAAVFLILSLLGSHPEQISAAGRKSLLTISTLFLVVYAGISIDRTRDWKDNYSVFKSGAENSPNSSRTNDGLATTYMNMAQETGDPAKRELYIDSAIIYYERSLSIFPENPKSAYGLAYIYSIRNKPDSAIKYYRQSLDAKPDYLFSLNNLGTLFANTGRFDSAYKYFIRSYDINQSDELVLTNLTVVCLNIGKTDECIGFGERALSLGFSSGKLYNLLSMAYARKGDKAKADQYNGLAAMKSAIK